MRIGFLGIGLMGAPMARRLAGAGHAVVAWNRTAGRAEALADAGVAVASTPAQAAAGAEAVVVMVSTGAVADEVLFGPNGAGAALARGAAVVVMSSIPVEIAREQARRFAAAGIDCVDAPVSGGVAGAADGRLAIMAGGDAAVVARLAPLFAPIGRVSHVGPAGAGQLAKLANQLIVGITIGAVAEALLLAERGGADPRAVRDALLGGFADSTVLRAHGERMLTGNFVPGGRATTQLKDLRTAHAHARSLGLSLPLTAHAERLYALLCAGPDADADHSVLYRALAAGLSGA